MATLDGDVQVPAVGKVPKKVAAGSVAVVGTLVVIYYVRKRKSASAASTAASGTSTDQYPPDGTTGNPQDPYSTDPATGQTYGDESVGSGGTYGAYGDASSADSGSFPWDGTVGNEDDPYSLDPGTGQTYGNEGSGSTGTGTTGGPPFANNSAWESWALQQLQADDSSFDTADAITALGLYLDGQPVSASQKTLIFDATGIAGDPPVAGKNNYPPNVKTNGDTGGSTTSTTGRVVIPAVKGKSIDAAEDALTAADLVPHIKQSLERHTTYVISSQTPGAGITVNKGSTVDLGVEVVPAKKK